MSIYNNKNTFNTFNYLLKGRWHTGYCGPYGQIEMEIDIINWALKDSKTNTYVKRILDFGCGNGIVTGDYAITYPQYLFYGVSNIQRDLDYAHKIASDRKLNNIMFIHIDKCKLPFDDNYFDCIVFTESLCHIQDKKKLFKEFNRILKQNGTMCGSEWMTIDPSHEMIHLINDTYDTYIYTLYQYFELAKLTGFTMNMKKICTETKH